MLKLTIYNWIHFYTVRIGIIKGSCGASQKFCIFSIEYILWIYFVHFYLPPKPKKHHDKITTTETSVCVCVSVSCVSVLLSLFYLVLLLWHLELDNLIELTPAENRFVLSWQSLIANSFCFTRSKDLCNFPIQPGMSMGVVIMQILFW